MNAKTPPERRAVPQSGAARLSKNIVSKDNKSIAAKHGSLSFARNRTSPFGADMPQSVISAPTLSHNRAISPRHRPPPQCGGGRWRGKSIDIKKQTETALVCKKTMFSIIFTIRCKYAAAQPIHAISYSFTKHRPSPHQTGSGEAVAVCLETIFTKNTYPPPGRPTPQSAVGRPGGGGMNDGRTLICRNLAAKRLSRAALISTRRNTVSKRRLRECGSMHAKV